jgi:hypothetical protein
MLHELCQELPRNVYFEQPVAVLREYRGHLHRLVHAEPGDQR